MREYGQYCPVALGSEVLADRWTPLIVREMTLGNTRFNDIGRCLPGISRTLLAQRLKQLERQGVVFRSPARAGRGSEYHLTDAGRDLFPILLAMGEWAVRWRYSDPTPADSDPVELTWWMHRLVDTTALPDRRVVIEFRYTGPRRTTIWIVLDRGEPSVCNQHPGFDTDILVTADPVSLMRVFSGIDTLRRAVRDGTVTVEGPSTLTRQLDRWFTWSPFAATTREHLRTRRSREKPAV